MTLDTHKLLSTVELSYKRKPALEPQHADLKRLYECIVGTRSLTVLEFGCGYSTLVIQEALNENRRWFENLQEKPVVRNSNMFKGFSVDTDVEWVDECSSKLTGDTIKIFCSKCNAVQINGQTCHVYASVPDVVPDFIYLDGPDPQQVHGWSMNGLSWGCLERTPMAADILLMEPTLIPGTTILIDGRTNNARFLENNLRRDWRFRTFEEQDQTVFYLAEPRLGKVNVVGRDICQ